MTIALLVGVKQSIVTFLGVLELSVKKCNSVLHCSYWQNYNCIVSLLRAAVVVVYVYSTTTTSVLHQRSSILLLGSTFQRSLDPGAQARLIFASCFLAGTAL